MNVKRIGLDLAKNVFELYGVDEHEPPLMAPQFVAPYRKNGKSHHNDAAAICKAMGRPNMRFVPVKEVEQQAVRTLHRTRSLLVAERTALVNHIRG
jgi:transposase